MHSEYTVVEGLVPDELNLDSTNLRDDRWWIALDKRDFGLRTLLVAFADDDGTFRGIASTDVVDNLSSAFEVCLDYMGDGAAVAIAYCDEPVEKGPPSQELIDRFTGHRAQAASHGIRLEDWISCDDDVFRTMSISVDDIDEIWVTPTGAHRGARSGKRSRRQKSRGRVRARCGYP